MRKSHVGLLHKKLVYALHFFLFISRHRAGQKQSKCELGKWECKVLGFSVHFHLLDVMFWKDNIPLLGNQLPSISFCFGHLSASSGSLLIFSLCSSQSWALRFHLWCEEVGSRKVRHVQVPANLQLLPFAQLCSAPWGSTVTLADIKTCAFHKWRAEVIRLYHTTHKG